MHRLIIALFTALLTLSACETGPTTAGSGGQTGAKVYKIRPGDTARIQFRALDSVNAIRQSTGAPALELDANLTASAATHSRDMSVQNRPWHFGSDGSSPLQRVARTGYVGQVRGEAISETYETELETVAAWMQEQGTKDVLLDPTARRMGFSWFQEPNGKIWWTLVTGT